VQFFRNLEAHRREAHLLWTKEGHAL
jgi:hypothetical protein